LAIYELKKSNPIIDMGMITNGVIMTPELISCYVNHFKWVRISLDASDDNTYYKIRGTKTLKLVEYNINQLLKEKKEKKSNLTIGLQIVVNNFNYNKIISIVTKMLNTFPEINYIQIRPIEIKLKEFPYTIDQLKIIDNALKYDYGTKKVIISDKWDLFFCNNSGFGFSSCHSSEFILTVSAYGEIYQCCHVLQNKEYRIGNINDDIETFFPKRELTLYGLKNKGFNPALCPLGCRGSAINKSLELFKKNGHQNFL
jgi:radical SAM protein with 4Fe4S-binding SPASM domain